MARRDDEAFGEFMRASSQRLLQIAWLLTGSTAAAEDLVQGTLERIYVAWPRIDEGGTLNYARRVLVNLHTDTWRRRRGEIVTESTPDQLVDDLTGQVDDAAWLATALAQLPPRERQCVVLRHHADLSEADVAALLGTSVGTVKSATSRGLAKLRETLVTQGDSHV